jgi:FkbM family methyltransferase
MALSDRNGMVELAVPEVVKARFEYGDSYLSMNPSATEGSSNAIPCRRLDEVLEEMNISKLDLIKIDVEGAEYLCLSGAERLLQEDHKPIILLECDEILSRRFGHSVFDTLLLLHQHGYECEQIGLHQWIARPRS